MNNSGDCALVRALAIQKCAAAVGFDWPNAEGPRAKIVEELAELDQEVQCSAKRGSRAAIAEELGDLVFAVVNYARHLDIEPEQALAAANEKFHRRFRYIEKRLATEGKCPQDVGLERLDELWEEAKRHYRSGS
jgi:uncharacterized protein YabN with tetrapyrrole methylase and pyrophosphatase domain